MYVKYMILFDKFYFSCMFGHVEALDGFPIKGSFKRRTKRKVSIMTTKKTPNEARQGQTSGNVRYVLLGSLVLAVIAAFVLISAY